MIQQFLPKLFQHTKEMTCILTKTKKLKSPKSYNCGVVGNHFLSGITFCHLIHPDSNVTIPSIRGPGERGVAQHDLLLRATALEAKGLMEFG